MEALVVVDVQNDYCTGGALAVPRGEDVVPAVLELIDSFCARNMPVFATQDWHPRNHVSFASSHPGYEPYEVATLPDGTQQMLFPDHCVQDTEGARLHPALERDARLRNIIRKGLDPLVDSYSAFYDNSMAHATDLNRRLRSLGVNAICVCGLTLDHCVKHTALDALGLGYRVSLPLHATRAANLNPGDDRRAIEELRAAGATII